MFQVVVQSLSHVQLFATLWITASQAPLSFTIFQSLLKLLSTESVISSNHLILRCPLLLLPVFPSIRVFSNEATLCIRWPKYWSFSINPSNEYSGLISFRMDWLISLESKRLSRVFSSTATLPAGVETVTCMKLPSSQVWALHMSAPADLILLLALKTEGGPVECRLPPES